MIKQNFHEKITLILSFLILNNYFILNFNFSVLLVKINFIFFLFFIAIYYSKNFFDNIYLKIFFLLILLISLGNPTFEWDARSIWLFHAKRIFFENSIFVFADNYAEFSNNDYPVLAPAFAASLATLIGQWNEIFPKTSFLLMFLPPLILTYVFLKDTVYIIFLSLVFFIIGKFLFNGLADGLVAIYFTLSALLMYQVVISDNDFYRKKLIFKFISLCFFISLTLIKNEGIVLLAILFISTFVIKLFKKEIKKDINKILFLSFSFLPIIFWKIFCYSNEIGSTFINENTILYLFTRFYDFENYKLIIYYLFFNEKFLVAFIFFCFSLSVNWNKEIFNFIFLLFLMYTFILFFIFLSTPFDLNWQLDSSAARIVKSLSFLLSFFGLYNLRNNKIFV